MLEDKNHIDKTLGMARMTSIHLYMLEDKNHKDRLQVNDLLELSSYTGNDHLAQPMFFKQIKMWMSSIIEMECLAQPFGV